jgi:hypothetical protein
MAIAYVDCRASSSSGKHFFSFLTFLSTEGYIIKDYDIYRKSHIFDLLESLFGSSVADHGCRKLTLDVRVLSLSWPFIN